ncbi:unnamed protein product, partial [marine sediment metagenome]
YPPHGSGNAQADRFHPVRGLTDPERERESLLQ